MTAINQSTQPAKWQASNIGPRQLKALNEAVSRFSWESKTITEITDFGQHDVTPMFSGPGNPLADSLMLDIQAIHGTMVTGDNYREIIGAILAGIEQLRQNRPVEDKRSTPEERQARENARIEQAAKEAAKQAHLASMVTHSYSLSETAAAAKRVLTTLFPNTKFSVKSESYSMGCSISTSWVDGPTDKQVNAVLDIFSCASFDGMQDLKTYNTAPEWNGHRFVFHGDYVRGQRSHSAVLLRECARRFVEETKLPAPVINSDGVHAYVVRENQPCGYKYFPPRFDDDCVLGTIALDDWGADSASDVVTQMAHWTSTELPTIPYAVEHREDTPEEFDVRSVVFRILLGEVSPQTPGRAITSAQGITISDNTEKQGIEIRFADKPATAILAKLKAHGWRWSRFTNCWYKKQSAEAAQFAQTLLTE